MMSKMAISFLCLILAVIFLIPEITRAQKADPTILDFKVQALYRAAKLTWKVKEGFKSGMSVQILRADTFEEGPYKEVEVVNLSPGKNVYEYVDKSMGSEAKYYYKLMIKETDESFGPIPTRPYFSPPATQYHPPTLRPRSDSILSLFFLPSKNREL
jgi:hypothetical protein